MRVHANGLQVYVGCTTVEHSEQKHRIIAGGTASLRMSAGETQNRTAQHSTAQHHSAGQDVQEGLCRVTKEGFSRGIRLQGYDGDCAIGALQAV